MRTNDIAYYAGRALTDAALTVVGVAGVIQGIQTIIAGLAGDVASAFVEGLSFGAGTPVVALTAAVSTVVAAVGAAEAGFSFALAANAFSNGLNNGGRLRDAILRWKSQVSASEIRAVDDSKVVDMMRAEDGHLLDKHVSMTNEELIRRAIQEDVNATSFNNQSTAINAVKENLRNNADAISNWINNTSDAKFTINYEHPYSVGYGAAEATKQVTTGLTKSRVVLVRDPMQALGFRILTGFPTF